MFGENLIDFGRVGVEGAFCLVSTSPCSMFQMVRVGGDSSRRSARHVRYDDIPTDTFTPRTYQVLNVRLLQLCI